MTAPKHAVSTILQIKLTSQQHHAFTTCSETCGLDLETWILQCAEVKAAAVIDALQAPLRKERQSRKKQRPYARTERDETEETEETEAADVVPEKSAQSPTLEAARSYNARFRRKPGEARNAPGGTP
jgi:Tfp pilus assembly protein PilP